MNSSVHLFYIFYSILLYPISKVKVFILLCSTIIMSLASLPPTLFSLIFFPSNRSIFLSDRSYYHGHLSTKREERRGKREERRGKREERREKRKGKADSAKRKLSMLLKRHHKLARRSENRIETLRMVVTDMSSKLEKLSIDAKQYEKGQIM